MRGDNGRREITPRVIVCIVLAFLQMPRTLETPEEKRINELAARRMGIPPLWQNSTMALNIKDKETEALVAELAAMTGETKTGAVRTAARERLERLRLQSGRPNPKKDAESFRRWLETEIWPQIPDDVRGKKISKAEREEILGYGPDGV
jgi:antitoxin VapB